MATGIGDLVANLSVDRSGWSAGLNAAKGEMEGFEGHAEGHVAGASRAFKFLGGQLKESAEGIGKVNESAGQLVGGLGSATQGAGELVHGLHALHTVQELVAGNQLAMMATSPAGLAVIAGAAIVAGVAYLTMSQHVETAEEHAKKLKETLGDIAGQTGAAFERGVIDKVKELRKNLADAENDFGKWTTIGAVAGPLGMGVGDIVDQQKINSAREALEDFNKAAEEHRRDEAIKDTTSELDKLQKKAFELSTTPLERFNAELKRTGESAAEIAEASKKFEELTRLVNSQKATAEISKKDLELREHGLSASQKYVDEMTCAHPEMSADRRQRLAAQGKEMDDQARADEQRVEAERERKEAQRHADSLVEAGKSPMQKIIEDAQKLRQESEKGLIDPGQFHAAGEELERRAAKQAQQDAPPPPQNLQAQEKDSDAAWKTILDAINGSSSDKENAQKTADATQKIAQILEEQKSNPAEQQINFGP